MKGAYREMGKNYECSLIEYPDFASETLVFLHFLNDFVKFAYDSRGICGSLARIYSHNKLRAVQETEKRRRPGRPFINCAGQRRK